MPWKEASNVSERVRMVQKWKAGLYSVSELAEEFGVSRPTVYEWVKREAEEGEAGLIDRSSAPRSCPHRTSPEKSAAIIQAKRTHPHWGPAKLIDWLRIEQPNQRWPAASTAGGILDGKGLVERRRKRRSGVIRQGGALGASESGQMMTADHKGQFRVGNGGYVYPVTITDPVSRFIYAIHGARSTSYLDAQKVFERVFREHGIPEFIGTDNGIPFSYSTALGGLSPLSVWWIKLGSTPVRIHPGSPWENGIHERMHKTLKAETARPPRPNFRLQQIRFDEFRKEFNCDRPHEGLNGRRPADVVQKCRRAYPRRLPDIDYPGHYEVRRVRTSGEICWKGSFIFVARALYRERVGLVEIDDGIWSLSFGPMELGRYDERTRTVA